MNRNDEKREENRFKMIVGVVCKDGKVCEKYADASEELIEKVREFSNAMFFFLRDDGIADKDTGATAHYCFI